MTSKELINRTKNFVHRCVKLASALPQSKLSNHIQGQLIRCSTSVAANYRATVIAQSKKALLQRSVLLLKKLTNPLFG